MSGKYCSPLHTNNTYTCFSNNDLVKIAKQYNEHNQDKLQIPSSKTLSDQSRKVLWDQLQQKLQSNAKCGSDYCIANTPLVKKAVGISGIMNTFRPAMPINWNDNPTEWLSTLDIDNVMSQYQQKHKDFIYMGAVPMDFDGQSTFGNGCVSNNLCNLNLRNLLKRGKSKIGVVFNSDPHNMPGAHWTSLFADVKKGGIYYFDSYGYAPTKEIQKLMLRIKEQGNKLITSNNLDINSLEDTHTVVRDYTPISKNQVQVDNSHLFFPTNMVFFGGYRNNTPKLDKRTANIIARRDNDILTMENPIKTSSNSPIIAMKSFRTFYNDKRFQFKNTECGVYSIHFIEEFLKGKSYDNIIENIMHDDDMQQKRRIYYTPNINSDA
jgi:hypothetical protein